MANILDKSKVGAKNACDYADISMKELDRYIHEEDIESKHGIKKPIMFERFRDDIFAIFPDEDSIQKCYILLNSFYDNISFTMSSISTEGLEFLDTFVSYDQEKHILHTKPYSKPCDSHCYLTPLSCHPTHILRNIPYNIAHRIYKISSNEDTYLESKNEYSKYLSDRGYSEEISTTSFDKVEKLSRYDLIHPTAKHKSTFTCIPFVMDYNPALPPMGKYINKHKHILEMDTELVRIINPDSIFISYRSNPTIKSIPVHSKLNSPSVDDNTLLGSIGCNNCKLCKDFLISPRIISSFHTTQTFNFKLLLGCKSTFVIYKIDDIICDRSYIGSTVSSLSTRWSNHKSHIRKHIRSCELTTHFFESDAHNFNGKTALKDFDNALKDHLKITLLDQLVFDDTFNPSSDHKVKLLKEREAYWQNQLRTLVGFGGLNKRDARKETKTKAYQTAG